MDGYDVEFWTLDSNHPDKMVINFFVGKLILYRLLFIDDLKNICFYYFQINIEVSEQPSVSN